MPIPTYDQFIEPILRYLAQHPQGAPAPVVHEAAAQALGLTPEERAETIPSGQHVFKNRSGWAHDRLKRAGLSASPRRGYWQLTPEGRAYAESNSSPLSPDRIRNLAQMTDEELPPAPESASSPDEKLEQAVQEIRHSVATDLLERLGVVSPTYFEVVVLDLLHKMGYGTNREDLRRVGGTGDAGIDGVITLDRLGFEKVYVQAKRWQGSVGRPEIQAFYGALAGQRASKGVFITTSGYTAAAREYAQSIERVVLIDGPRLAELMIDFEVGVSVRQLRLPRVDGDYFEEV